MDQIFQPKYCRSKIQDYGYKVYAGRGQTSLVRQRCTFRSNQSDKILASIYIVGCRQLWLVPLRYLCQM